MLADRQTLCPWPIPRPTTKGQPCSCASVTKVDGTICCVLRPEGSVIHLARPNGPQFNRLGETMSQSLARVWLHVVFSTKPRRAYLQNDVFRDEIEIDERNVWY
jgi:hypothetical protein